jgi:hypothetical protein
MMLKVVAEKVNLRQGTKMKFPQYRKLAGGIKYYKITSHTAWEEIGFMGKRKLIKVHTATQLPERNFILDLLEYREGKAEAITEDEYNRIKAG